MTSYYTFFLVLFFTHCLYLHSSLPKKPEEQAETVEKRKLDPDWILILDSGNTEKIQKFLDSSGVNVRLLAGQTPLIHAISRGDENLVKYLLKVPGIDVNIQDRAKLTPFMWAAAWNRENIAKLLLEVPGIKLNAKNKHGETAYDFAKGRKYPALEKLIKNKIDELTEKAFEAIRINDVARSNL